MPRTKPSSTCPDCHGTGEIDVVRDGTLVPPMWSWIPHGDPVIGMRVTTIYCSTCKGSGYE